MGFRDATLRNGFVKNPSFRTSPLVRPRPITPTTTAPGQPLMANLEGDPGAPRAYPHGGARTLSPSSRTAGAPSKQLPAPSGPSSPFALPAVPLASQLPRAVTAPHATDAHDAAPATHLPSDPRASAGESPKRGVRCLHARQAGHEGAECRGASSPFSSSPGPGAPPCRLSQTGLPLPARSPLPPPPSPAPAAKPAAVGAILGVTEKARRRGLWPRRPITGRV